MSENQVSIGLQLELIVAECFELDEKYKLDKLSTPTKWLLAEVGRWAVGQYAGEPELVTKAEIIKAVDSRWQSVGMRPHDGKVKRLKTFHASTISETGIIAESVRRKPKSTLDEMEKARESERNFFDPTA